ncbi:antitoxin [Extensimonas vulgaris]|uniref:Antidote-toxin recognition antitoxin MazE n=1 Tax=Extensimonas vulgaris TaxID=1031594 RepID=A0A369AR55_9BURK|nr:antidote-toxin recognition antitoxin MazE [Extensimonas vulgaris]TWI40390.1 antidote-toxin recognition antitoxin MazE [Extensimonas vulgaris]TXD16416.1 AbrB/MazE/SpoVT family DNA-binding domain-containing protein [Extensimonas vulgaris]
MPHVAASTAVDRPQPEAAQAPTAGAAVPTAAVNPGADTDTTKIRRVRLFRNGANQAVRIPKEFELPGKEALVRREGNRLIIEVVPEQPPKGTAAALAAALQEIAALGPCTEPFPDIDDSDLLPLDDIRFEDDDHA